VSLVVIDWMPDRRGLRSFGASVLIGGAIVGLAAFEGWFPFRQVHSSAAAAIWGACAAVGVLGVCGVRAVLPVYWAWMGVAFVAGSIVSRVVLVVTYFGVVTPVGLAMRVVGRDRLSLQKRDVPTYWADAEPGDAARHERQF
jgi:carbamoyltransferase